MSYIYQNSYKDQTIPPESELDELVSRLYNRDHTRLFALHYLRLLVQTFPTTSGQRIFDYVTGPDYKPIRPLLMKVLTLSAAPKLFQPMLGLLWHADKQIRELVTEGFTKNHNSEFSPTLFDRLLEVMQDSDENVRANVARIIGSQYFRPRRLLLRGHAPLSAEQVNLIIKLVGENEGSVRMSLLRVLGSPAKVCSPAIPLLIESLSDVRYPGVVIVAAEALGEIGPAALPAIPSLLSCLNHSDARVRWYAAEALGRIGKAYPAEIESLLAATNDPNSLVRQHAIIALGHLEREGKALVVVDRLLQLTYNTDEKLRERSAHQLGAMEVKEKQVIDRLVEMLADPNTTVQNEAIVALGKVGDKSHMPLLEKFITLEPVYTDYSEIIGQQAKIVIEKLATLLD